MKPDVLENLQNDVQEDDSPYLSISDFFSLLSLTLIFAMVVLTPAPSVPESTVRLLSGRLSTSGEGVAFDPNSAYFGIIPLAENEAELRFSRAGSTGNQSTAITLEDSTVSSARKWMEAVLLEGEVPTRVVFYVDSSVPPPASGILLKLASSMSRNYLVDIVEFDHADEPQGE